MIRTLQKVLVDLEYSSHGVIDTTGLVTSLQLPTTEQQDVVEFGELLFGLLNNSIPSLQVRTTAKIFTHYFFIFTKLFQSVSNATNSNLIELNRTIPN